MIKIILINYKTAQYNLKSGMSPIEACMIKTFDYIYIADISSPVNGRPILKPMRPVSA